MQSLLHTEGELGDFRLLDITDPRHPTEVADWDLRRDLVEPDDQDAVKAIDLHTHSVTLSGDGMTAWLAAWDGGVVELDLSDPATPVPVLQIPVADGSNGNAHTVAVDLDSGLLIRNDENLEPESTANKITAWGGQTIYDISNLERPAVLATYSSSGAILADGNPDYSGYFSAHEVVLSRGIEYVSWYSDGLRIVDLSDPSQPEELGSFVPGGTGDPQRHWVTPTGERAFPMVWGVAVVNGLIYLSDMNTGLWIVRYTPPLLDPQLEAGTAL